MLNLISIIVPVYAVEKYLNECIDSLLNQTYKNIEILLIVDKGDDRCEEICDKYEEGDHRIRVFHKEHAGGLSAARNLGLYYAKGDFIGFVDSDDYIEPIMYEEMLNIMLKKRADIVEIRDKSLFQDGIACGTYTGKVFEYSGLAALKMQLSGKSKEGLPIPIPAVWSRLFRRKIIIDIRFPVDRVSEDFPVDAMTMMRSQRYCFIDKPLYIYRERPNSLSHIEFNKKTLDRIETYKIRLEYIKKYGTKELTDLAEIAYYKCLITFYFEAGENNLKEEKEEIKQRLWKERTKVLKLRCGFNQKLKFILYYISPKLFRIFQKIHISKYA